MFCRRPDERQKGLSEASSSRNGEEGPWVDQISGVAHSGLYWMWHPGRVERGKEDDVKDCRHILSTLPTFLPCL